MAPNVCAIAFAEITAATGTLNFAARSALLGVPSNRPITPSIRIRYASRAGFARGVREQCAARAFADHPQIERQNRRAARARENHRVQKIRARLEHANLTT